MGITAKVGLGFYLSEHQDEDSYDNLNFLRKTKCNQFLD